MANRYLFPSSLSSSVWDTTTTTIWSAADPLRFNASCSGTTLTTSGSPALVVGMTVRANSFASLGTITGGSANTWTVSIGGTYASQNMGAATIGASVPTTADDVFIPNPLMLAGIVTLTINNGAACRNYTQLSGARVQTTSGLVTWTIAGSFNCNYGFGFAGTMLMTSTTTGNTFFCSGSIISNTIINFNGVGGEWTFTGALNATLITIILTNGTLDTGGYNLSIRTLSSSNSNTRTLTLGASVISLQQQNSAWDLTNITNLTFNVGTSIIEISGNSATFAGGGFSYNTLRFVNVAPTGSTITGNNTFGTLSVVARTSVGVGVIAFSDNQTINTLTLSASSDVGMRTFLRSSVINTSKTLTVGAFTAGSANIDFRDINISGAASPISGTRFGDCDGSNSGITFDAAKTVYWNLAGAQNWNSTGWALTSGGAPAVNNFPLAQDTAVFDDTGSVTGVITINTSYNIRLIDMSARTTAMTLATGTSTPSIYFGWKNGSGTTLTGTGAINFFGRGSMQIVSAGKSFTQNLTMINPSGTLVPQDATTASTVTLTEGTLDLNNLVLTCSTSFSSNNANTRTIAFGTGSIACSGTGTVWNTSTSTGLATTGSKLVSVTSSGAVGITVSPGTLNEENAISFSFTAGTYGLTLTAGSNFRDLDFTGYAGALANTASTIYGDFKVSTGMTLTAGVNARTFAGTFGIDKITTNGKTFDFPLTFNGVGGTWQLQDNLTVGGTRAFTLSNGTFDINGKTTSVGAVTVSAGVASISSGTLICTSVTHTSGSLTFGSSTAINASGAYTFTAGAISLNNGSITSTSFSSTGAGIRLLSLGATGTWTITGSGAAWTASGTNFTSVTGGTINMTSATAKTFAGGGFATWPKLNQGGAGALTISGSNRFGGLSNTVQPATITFTAGTTNFFESFTVSGTAGNLVTLGSTSAAQAFLQKPTPWYMGANSVNGGNNTGLTFTAGAGVDYLSASYINGSQRGAGPGNFFVFF